MKATQEQLWQLRALATDLGWGEFMEHVRGIMAEQADRLSDGDQANELLSCSQTIGALGQFFEKCGRYDYLRDPLTPDEYLGLFV